MISRHNCWLEGKQRKRARLIVGTYLESPVGIPSIHLEMFNSHGGSRVFSVAHVCKPTAAADSSDVYGLPLNKVGGRYDTAGFADLRKEQQAPLPQFVVEG